MLPHYDTDGAIIIRDLVDSDTISEMRQAVIERARRTRTGITSRQRQLAIRNKTTVAGRTRDYSEHDVGA
jgi:hypothetical protein